MTRTAFPFAPSNTTGEVTSEAIGEAIGTSRTAASTATATAERTIASGNSAQQTVLDSIPASKRHNMQAARCEARLVDAAQRLRAVEQSPLASVGEIAAMLDRAHALHARARDAAKRRAYWLADDFIMQIDAELVLAMNDEQRRALFSALALQQPGLAAQFASTSAPSTAAVQLLLRTRNAALQTESYNVAVLRRQVPALLWLLAAATGFGLLWALAGGFEWIVNEDIDVSLAMITATGMLLGLFGGVLSVLLDVIRPTARARQVGTVPELRAGYGVLAVRVLAGAALALPIVLFMQSGVLNLGAAPASTLLLCFAGGFIERVFVRRLERASA